MYTYPAFFGIPGVEEAMGVENSGVLYALWSYPAQAADELSFKEGDMVTILQKHEGDWWWALLCGREGFVPCNYFGVRYQSLNKGLNTTHNKNMNVNVFFFFFNFSFSQEFNQNLSAKWSLDQPWSNWC